MATSSGPRHSPLLVVVGAALVLAVAAIAGWLITRDDTPTAEAQAPTPLQQFRSRGDLHPPALTVPVPSTDASRGLVFLAPKGGTGQMGPMIVDGRGRMVWFKPMPPGIIANDFSVQRYAGQPVLTWWEGRTNGRGSQGRGSYVIMDGSYHEIARVWAGNGLAGDLHDFQITPRGTAWMLIYDEVPKDLSAMGGPSDGVVTDSVVQEVDIATGKVLFQWRSLDHVGMDESHSKPPGKGSKIPYDYFHVNSVDEDADGNLLISARNTWAVYKVDRASGRIVWRMGGKRSDFDLGPGVRYAWQHDARWRSARTMTLFDNEATPKVGDRSRALTLSVDQRRKRVRLVRALSHPGVLAIAEGNTQPLGGGATFVGWGYTGRASEFAPDGSLSFDLAMPKGVESYRVYRQPWTGRPAGLPAVAVARGDDGRLSAYASFNGATGVTGWEVLAGSEPGSLAPAGSADSAGFETRIAVAGNPAYVAVRALAGDLPLATSRPVRVG